MRLRRVKISLTFFILLFLGSCAQTPHYSWKKKEDYLKDPIRVEVAIQLAHAAYLKSCTINSAGKLSFKECKAAADKYVESDILAIMNQ